MAHSKWLFPTNLIYFSLMIISQGVGARATKLGKDMEILFPFSKKYSFFFNVTTGGHFFSCKYKIALKGVRACYVNKNFLKDQSLGCMGCLASLQ